MSYYVRTVFTATTVTVIKLYGEKKDYFIMHLSNKNRETAEMKMLQAQFDYACSWMEVVTASYRPRLLSPA
jgi:hypothetical protein